jgi:predicted chitinase
MSSKENADYLMQAAMNSGIRNHKELANFMGQMQVESWNFDSMNEKLGYSGLHLLKKFKGRNGLSTPEQANDIAACGPKAVAEAIYGGDWGKDHLGNTQEGDAWRYHGRGYVQLTGRDSYQTVGNALGLDLINHPELAADRNIAAQIAIHY